MLVLKGKNLAVLEEFVTAFSMLEWHNYSSLPEYQALVDNLVSLRKKILCENDARQILQEVVIDFVIGKKVNTLTNLSDKEIKTLKEELFNNLKSYIESLPRKYQIRIEIPNFPNWGEFSIDLSDRIKLVSGNFKFNDDSLFGSLSEKSTLSQLLNPISDLKTFLLIKTTGYCSPLPNSPATAEAISVGKQCAFLLTSFGLMIRSYHKGARANLETIKPSKKEMIQLPESISNCFQLLPNEEKLLIYGNSGFSLLGDPGRKAETNEEKVKVFEAILYRLRDYFRKAKHPDFRSISAAIEWYQDSIFSDNQTFSYLAAGIGLEALLGTEDFMDMMSKRLSDRFATLMGKGRTERNKLAKEYTEVLRLRGEIVHAKEARLTVKHQQSLTKIQRMLLDVIWHELHELYKDEKPLENHLISRKSARQNAAHKGA